MRVLLVIVVALSLVSAIACSGGDKPEPTAVPSATSASTATTTTPSSAPQPPIPGYTSDRRTGDPGVDSVLDAVTSGDVGRVRSLLRFYPVACKAELTQLGSPEPKCPTGTPEGTPIDIFPNGSCPSYRSNTREDIDVLLNGLANPAARPYAVYRRTPVPPDGLAFPHGSIGVVLTVLAPTPSSVGPNYSVWRMEIDAGQIIIAGVACPSAPVQQVLENLQVQPGDFLLPPPP
ncbi:MAG: hypothetical protein WBO97_16390 [Tepidiformaceae bacterium]